MTAWTEGNLRFDFDDRWTVVKYDGPDPGDYRAKMNLLEDTKAVDFIALFQSPELPDQLYWIEVKDYRTQPRPSPQELGTIIAQKTRDSIAGAIGFYRTSSAPEVWRPFVEALSRKGTVIKVLFWLEERPLPAQRRTARLQVQVMEIKRRMKWLTTKVTVTRQGLGGIPEGLTVSDIHP